MGFDIASSSDRRTKPRFSTGMIGWRGSYTLPGHPRPGTGECRVCDVSESGASFELWGPWPWQDTGQEILVRIRRPPDDLLGPELRGVVRNRTVSNSGAVRVGVEFGPLGPDERRYLEELARQAQLHPLADPSH